ncbi:NAD-dependent epimerase/dehydratase family protein [Runella rosea]|uniref:NAD-dependent epimerase/dehydratase family protein n=1 Tax=Runella rosea TaxID=2259595 RepID=UPI001962C29C|nr:NAD(P)-dependent oxidoreductase [Runella rosea]
MKVLVTGASGFIGNQVVNNLLSQKHQVIATSRDENKVRLKTWYNKVKYIPFDISNFDSNLNLYEYFNRPDVLIHLAWDGLPNFLDIVHIEKNLFTHYQFLKNYIQNGGKHITAIGTCLEYGKNEGCLSEDKVPEPDCAYAIAKDSLRRFIEELQKNQFFVFHWIRLFYMYGEGQYSKAILSQLETAVQKGDSVFNMSGGEQLRDYLSIEKVAQNIVAIALQKKIVGIINCSSGQPISVRRLVEDYISKNNYSIKLNFGFYPYPNYEPLAFWGNNQKLNNIINE